MKELVFALQFRGKARPIEGVEGKLAAKTTAAGQVLRTALTAKGVQVRAESRPGPRATFESEVQANVPWRLKPWLPSGTPVQGGVDTRGRRERFGGGRA
jgi:hypothetical protein